MYWSRILLFISLAGSQIICHAQTPAESAGSCVEIGSYFFNRQNPAAGCPETNKFYSEFSFNPYIYQVDGLSSGSALISNGFDNFSATISIDGINADNYFETRTSGIFSYRLINTSFGVSVNYSNVRIDGFGSQSKTDLSFGAILAIYDKLKAGFSFNNALGSRYSKLKDASSQRACFGLAWMPLEGLSVEGTAFVRINYYGGTILRLFYKINGLLSAGGSVCTKPATCSFESDLNFSGNTRLKLYLLKHELLGWSPAIAIGFLF